MIKFLRSDDVCSRLYTLTFVNVLTVHGGFHTCNTEFSSRVALTYKTSDYDMCSGSSYTVAVVTSHGGGSDDESVDDEMSQNSGSSTEKSPRVKVKQWN